MNNLKKKLKKEISRRTKDIQKYEKERLDKAWMNLLMQMNIKK
ncbi:MULTISPECIES: DUF3983 domain-containing protein [Bacillus cereus group]|nr:MULTISPECIES: DUF3983 domain-containing protein [Bacillus cereus group]